MTSKVSQEEFLVRGQMNKGTMGIPNGMTRLVRPRKGEALVEEDMRTKIEAHILAI